MTAQTPTPDNTRRETIEECAQAVAKLRERFEEANTVRGRLSQIYMFAANQFERAEAAIRALASAEPQAREAMMEEALHRIVGATPRNTNSETADKVASWCRAVAAAALGYDDPAPAPAAETEGLVERLTRELAREEDAHLQTIDQRDRLHDIADALAGAIAGEPVDGETLGSHSSINCPWQNALQIAEDRTQLAARTQPSEIAEALEPFRKLVEMIEKERPGKAIGDRRIVAITPRQDGEAAALTMGDLRLLLASTGSRQEPAGAMSVLNDLKREIGSFEMDGPDGATTTVEAFIDAALHSQPASRDSNEAMREACLPRLDDGLIEAAMRGHYGVKATRIGIDGVDLTANEINYSFLTGFIRMWAGVRKELRRRALPTPHSGSAS